MNDYKNHQISVSQGGFTLIELLMAMALVGIMTVFMAAVFRGTIRLYHNQTLEIQVVEAATLLNKFLLQNLRRAELVKDTIVDGSDVFVSDSDEIILQIPAIDGSNNPIVGVYDYYVFYPDDTNLGDFRWRLIPDSQSSRIPFDHLAAEEITSLEISYNAQIPAEAGLVTVNFTLEKENSFGPISISRSTSINLRNQ